MQPHFLESCWPGLFYSEGFQGFAAMVSAPGFTLAVDVILLLNLVVLVMEGMVRPALVLGSKGKNGTEL